MNGQGRPWLRNLVHSLCCIVAVFASVAAGADVPPTWRDDATLRDVQFITPERGWAVGDHGTLWLTSDGGTTWDLQSTGMTGELRSVCFINDREGWIAGGQSLPYSHIGQGILLHTTDGGRTWQAIGGENLLEFHRIKFFTQKHGIAVGEPNQQTPSGVMQTRDGGMTWISAPGTTTGSWRAADFLHPEAGSLGGLRGQRAIYGAGRLVPHTLASLGLRGVYDLQLTGNGAGWLVGDGGLILHSPDSGISWEPVIGALPDQIRTVFDFRAVAARGEKVWVAGEPGSIIWHSTDRGQTWERQPTRESLPIHGLQFVDDQHGCAVGALGLILQTDDGGLTWLAARGGGRRAAYLAAMGRTEAISLNLVGKLSGEQGYRGVVSVIPRQDVGPDTIPDRELDLRLQEATTYCGGATGKTGWQWTLEIPGIANSDKLIEQWTLQSEGKFAEQFVGNLVRQVRTWRPSVIIIEEPSAQDSLSRLIKQAMLVALRQSGEATRFPEHLEVADLAPWSVPRVFVRLSSGSSGQVLLAPHDFLPRTGKSLSSATATGSALLWRERGALQTEAYRAIELDGSPAKQIGQDFFAGLSLNPGGDARRDLPPVPEADLTRNLKLAQMQRNYQSYVDKFLHEGRHANQLLAQLGDFTAGLPNDQAALQLASLADAYRQQGQWDLCESVLTELVERYPREAPAQNAMRQLFQLWCGLEPAFVRNQHRRTQERTEVRIDQKQMQRRMQSATRLYLPGQNAPTNQAIADELDLLDPSEANAIQRRYAPITLKTGLDGTLGQAQQELWFDKARRMAQLLEKTNPQWYRSPEIQAPLASLMRQRQQLSEVRQIYPQLVSGAENSPWTQTANTELWLMTGVGIPPKSIYNAAVTTEAPQLDGLLTDPCWQAATEMPLTQSQTTGPLGEQALLLMCRDDEYLYLAGVMPRAPGTTAPEIELAGRQHDSDLTNQDQLTIILDLDRDYTTYYRLQVDQRGSTAEDCWGDASWNPKWYVACMGDELAWRVEVAIPWSELCGAAPPRGSAWAMQAYRTVPGVGLQTWTTPAASQPRLETGGLLRFE